MKKRFTILITAAFMLLTMMASTGTMWGQTRTEEVYKTALFGSSYNSTGVSSYTATWTATNNGFTVSLSNFNNNNNSWDYVKCGRKNNASVGTITTSAAISEAITKVDVAIDAITASNVNSIKLYTSSNGSSWTEAGTYTKATGTKSVSLTSPTANLYYKLEFDCASGSANGLVTVSKVEFYHNTGGNPTVTTPEITPNGGSFLDSQEVSISCATTGATIYYTTDGSTPSTTSTQYTTPFTIDETTTVKAYAVLTNYDDSQVATATFTKEIPMTVAEARDYIDGLNGATSPTDVYVTGVISQIDSYSSQYHSITYWISDDGTATDQLEVYSGKGLNGADFSAVTDLTLGSTVIVKGKVKLYSSTYEFTQNSQIVSLTPPSTPYITAEDVNITYNATAGSIAYTVENSVSGGQLTAATTSTWLTLSTEFASPIAFTCSANEAGERTTTVTLTYTYGNEQTTTKEVTVTQAGNPNVFDNISDITEVGTAYSIKGTVVATNNRGFIMGDGTGYAYYYNNGTVSQSIGDMVTLSGTTGTYGHIIQFTNSATVEVATSSNYDGTPAATIITAVPDYSTGYHLSTYLEFEGALAKTSGNYLITVGESQIQISYPTTDQGTALTALVGKTVHVKGYFSGINSSSKFTVMLESAEEVVIPSITVNPTSVEAPADETQGTITVTLTAIADNEIEVQWFESDGTTAATYNHDWVLTDVNTDKNIDYVIGANTGAARTAYFKVYGLDNDGDDVYSDLVTISQAAYVAPTPSIAVTPTLVEATADETQGTITVTLTAIANNEIEVQWFESDGTTAATYNHDWVLTDVNTDKNIDYVIGANTGAARTAYFKVYGLDNDGDDVYSELVTINQAAGTTPPTPGQYDWVATDLADLTANDVFVIVGDNGDTYAMSNNNSTSKAPATVEVTIANNKITSSVGDTIQWKLSGNATNGYTFYPNGSTTTWLYCNTTASSGSNNNMRVGTGNRKLFEMNSSNYLLTKDDNTTRYLSIYNNADWRGYINEDLCPEISFFKRVPASTEPSITLNQYTYNLNADGGDAELPVTTANLAAEPQLDVVFYESDGVTPATYDWITATINNAGNIAGHIDENEGAARTAYFKVSGLANDNTTTVYSDLVTINQAAATAPSIVFETASMSLEAGGEQDRKLSFNYSGLGSAPSFTINYYEQDGTTAVTAATYDWLTATIEGDKLNVTAVANTGEARSAYLKVYGEKNANVHTESNLVTINQAEYVAPTYTVTYNANGGTGTMTDSNSPYVENAEVTLLENTFGAPEGKIWDSWLVKDADQNTISVNEGKFNMPASNVTVTAQWVDDPSGPTYEWVLTALEDLTSSDVFVIVGTRTDETYGGTYAMSNNKGTSNPPDAIAVTIVNNKLSGEAPDTIKWNISGNATDGYTFYPNGSTKSWLYCTATNNGVRVGTNDNKTFVVDGGYMKHVSTSRYVGIYNSQDWRCYTSNTGTSNIANQTFGFYKRQVASTVPQLYTNDVNIASDATAGTITYSIENEVTGGVLSAEITAGNEGNWLTLGTVGENVPFTCSANTEQTERTATITLTYTYNAKATVTATAVVTQAAFIIDFATLPFEYDGNGTGELPVGLTPTGVGTYSQSPAMKFDGAGDNLILKLDAAPTSLSYDIKGNGSGSDSWAGTFKVQTSADGETYEDLVVYENNLGATQSITHINLASTVRYIKWVYVTKTTGNVALGNIHASDEYEIYGDMTINSDDLAAQPVIVHNGSVVTFVGTNTNAADLVIEDGGQLIHDNAGVEATIKKNINGYSNSKDKDNNGYLLIASPVESDLIVATQTNLTEGDYDLYYFDHSYEHKEWRNYKKTDNPEPFTSIKNGIGYLYANTQDITISFSGELKPSLNVVQVDLTYVDGKPFSGWNLVGNPFACNAYIIGATEKVEAYYKMNDNGNGFVASTDAIDPMEGIFVQASATDQSFFFTRNEPSKGVSNLNLQVAQVVNNRDAQPATDNAIIRFDNGNALEKFSFRDNTTKVYIPQGNKDYAVVSAEAQGEMPVNFKAAENGTYTIDFSMDNVEFSYLHLIDNKTGMDIDLLQTSSYTFEASKIDYASRFKLVFSTNNNSNSNDDNDFAFFDANGNLLILGNEGTATLQVIDITGRTVSNETFSGNYSKAINAKAGVYMLRLIQGNDVRTQKIVVR